jgi:hypothetical protein
MTPLYAPPSGRYDLPFTWVFDASGLTDGSTYLSQIVYLQGGYGDFVLRRIVGIDRVCNPNQSGMFQTYDKSRNPIQADPVNSQNVTDIALIPELWYPETGILRFDLYGVLRDTEQNDAQGNPIYCSQLAFQGVRRIQGNGNPFFSTVKKFTAHTYTYVVPWATSGPGVRNTVYLQISDFDFELYDIKIIYESQANYTIPDAGGISMFAVPTGAAGNAVSCFINYTNAPNLPLTIAVTGQEVDVQLATDASGNITTTVSDLLNLINSNQYANRLVYVTYGGNVHDIAAPGGGQLSGGGASLPGCWSALLLYDANKETIANQPVLDVFMNEVGTKPNGSVAYGNGAIVPPLLYPVQSVMRIDVLSLSPNPVGMLIHLIGKQRIPC